MKDPTSVSPPGLPPNKRLPYLCLLYGKGLPARAGRQVPPGKGLSASASKGLLARASRPYMGLFH